MKNISIFTFIAMSLVASFGSTKVSEIMSVKNEPQIKLDAFINLTKNLKELSNIKNENNTNVIEIKKEDLVISSIEKELNVKIKNQYKLVSLRETKRNNYILVSLKDIRKKEISSPLIIKEKSKTNSLNLDSGKIKNNNEDLSKYEINNSEFVEVFAYNASKITFIEYKINEIDVLAKVATNINNPLEDKVSVKFASTVGPIEPNEELKQNLQGESLNIEKEIANNEINDDLKVYDYSEKKAETETQQVQRKMSTQKIDRQLYERPISDTVKKAISREIGSKKSIGDNQLSIKNQLHLEKNEIKNNIKEIEVPSEFQTDGKIDEISLGSSAIKHDKEEDALIAFSNQVSSTESIQTQSAKIKNIEVNMDTHRINIGTNFEFIPDFDRNERVYDNGIGELEYGYSTRNKLEITTGTINKPGSFPTRIDLVLDNNIKTVPSFDENSYRKFLETNQISKTNSIIIQLNNSIEDVDIDSNFEKKLLLDKNFRQTEGEKKYIMFAGVRTGNILIKYKTIDTPTAQKIIYIGEDEIYFEYPEFDETHRENFELTTRNVMSSKNRELNLSAENVKVFNTNIASKKSALNVYELKLPPTPNGNRKYLELNYQGNSVFVGTQSKNKIEIPQKEFIEKVLDFNQVSSLDQKCLVQINLSKEVSNIKTSGKNITGDMYVETSSLDSEGKLSNENFEYAEKIFLLGEQEGIMNAHLEYIDGTVENLKTFCSNNAFLVEQL